MHYTLRGSKSSYADHGTTPVTVALVDDYDIVVMGIETFSSSTKIAKRSPSWTPTCPFPTWSTSSYITPSRSRSRRCAGIALLVHCHLAVDVCSDSCARSVRAANLGLLVRSSIGPSCHYQKPRAPMSEVVWG
jgi:hypothetical protein